MIKLSWGKQELGFWPSVQEACDSASSYMFLRELHAQFNWEEIRRRAQLCQNNMSVSIDGLMFEKINLHELDDFDKAAVDMARTTEALRRKYEQGEHPEFDRNWWKVQVENDETQLGYWEWVVHRAEENVQ